MSEHIDIVTRRWAPEILLALAPSAIRFNRLMDIPGISDRMLTVRLNELVDAGLVTRHVRTERPIQVLYGLTDAGMRFVQPLQALKEVALA